MKKTITLILALVFALALPACAKTANDRASNPSNPDILPQPDAQSANFTGPQAADSELISRQQAIDIALRHAGLTQSTVYDLEAELDRELTGIYWEVDFETRELEYAYDIDAKTGEIVRDRQERNN